MSRAHTPPTRPESAPGAHDLAAEAHNPRPVADGVLQAIGSTPLVRLSRVLPRSDLELFAKLEMLNPGGSMKDRPALGMLRAALDAGRLAPGGLVVESTSGNMGVGLAQACAYLQLRFICVVDERTTAANQKLLAAYGATVDVVRAPHPETGDWLDARLARIQGVLAEHPDALWLDQYTNLENPQAHATETAPELIRELGRPPDVMLVPTSTCGTVRGFSDYLRSIGASTRVVAVDAVGSLLFREERHARLIPGLGSSQRPHLIDPDLVEVVHVTTAECVAGCRLLATREAILGGGSSGGLVAAAIRLVSTLPAGSRLAMCLPDSGSRYLDTIYDDDWVAQHVGEPVDLLAEHVDA